MFWDSPNAVHTVSLTDDQLHALQRVVNTRLGNSQADVIAALHRLGNRLASTQVREGTTSLVRVPATEVYRGMAEIRQMLGET